GRSLDPALTLRTLARVVCPLVSSSKCNVNRIHSPTPTLCRVQRMAVLRLSLAIRAMWSMSRRPLIAAGTGDGMRCANESLVDGYALMLRIGLDSSDVCIRQ